jgi:alanine dehydrogenase
MIIGVLKEIKIDESRVSLLPVGAELLIEHGHLILIETQAGSASGFSDDQYVSAGATVVSSAQEVYQRADLIIKVKEPLPQEHAFFAGRTNHFYLFPFCGFRKINPGNYPYQLYRYRLRNHRNSGWPFTSPNTHE